MQVLTVGGPQIILACHIVSMSCCRCHVGAVMFTFLHKGLSMSCWRVLGLLCAFLCPLVWRVIGYLVIMLACHVVSMSFGVVGVSCWRASGLLCTLLCPLDRTCCLHWPHFFCRLCVCATPLCLWEHPWLHPCVCGCPCFAVGVSLATPFLSALALEIFSVWLFWSLEAYPLATLKTLA